MELLPHFTWQVVARYDVAQLEPVLRDLARVTPPFMVRASGLGIFTWQNPIIYIHLIKNRRLMELHELIWLNTECCAIHPSHYYSPENWVPHITLASENVNRQNMACALDTLAFEPFEWELHVDSLSLLRSPDSTVGLDLLHIPLEGCLNGS